MRLSILTPVRCTDTSFAAQPGCPRRPFLLWPRQAKMSFISCNAFAKVFEPSPRALSLSKFLRNDIAESSLDDLFFQVRRMRISTAKPARHDRSKAKVRFYRSTRWLHFHEFSRLKADKIDVKLRDGRNFPAKLVGTDEKTDIVWQDDARDLPVVQLADSDGVG
jgi:hypothetical protein